jgi:hypothetical protein
MVIKIGVVLNDTLLNQQSFLIINQLNALVRNPDCDAVLFCENKTPTCIPPEVPIMNVADISKFDGLLIATNLNNAEMVMKCISPSKKIFYVWELEWLRGKQDFERNVATYRRLPLVARSDDHAKAIFNYCNEPVTSVIPLFNIGEIINEFC